MDKDIHYIKHLGPIGSAIGSNRASYIFYCGLTYNTSTGPIGGRRSIPSITTNIASVTCTACEDACGMDLLRKLAQ